MTPAARIQAAIEIVDRWRAASEGMDRVLAAWGRANRYAGSGDRRAIADLVYDALRRMRSASWVAGVPEPAAGRALILGSLVLDGHDAGSLGAIFAGARHAPPPLTTEEVGRLGRPLADAPRAVRLDYPDWLAPDFDRLPDEALEPTRQRAPVHLRVNTLRADQGDAIAALAEDGIVAEPGPLSSTALTATAGATRIARSRAYLEGLVELQDAASQAAADYAAAQPGETVLDYCAGGGGKALALAAAMGGQGVLHAHDIAPQRLAQMAERAQRAGAKVVCHEAGQTGVLAGRCDLVFVDAPCSGSGAWRRNPDAKWRLTPDRLAELTGAQDSVLSEAAAAVGPGGRLVYATCSLLGAENRERVAAFLARHPGFRAGRPPLVLTPRDGGDGFFAAEMMRDAA